MKDSAGVDNVGERRATLKREIRARENDGWAVVDRSEFEATLLHTVRAPWWLILSDLAFAGGVRTAERYLHVEVFDDGELFRATIGDIPAGWPKKRAWDIVDGPSHCNVEPPAG